MECPEAAEKIEAGDQIEVDFDTGVITNQTKNETYQSQPLPPFLQKSLGLLLSSNQRINFSTFYIKVFSNTSLLILAGNHYFSVSYIFSIN